MGHKILQKIIRYYLDITSLLEELLKVNVEFKWNVKCNESFEIIKKKIVQASILRLLDYSNKFYVHVDELGIIVGVILTQLGDEGLNHHNTNAI